MATLCVMSSWLFNVVGREINARALRRWLMLIDQGVNNWRVNQLLYADDAVLLGDSKDKI